LATAHTATIPGRFNAGNPARPGFEVLYFAEDHTVALFEVQALLGSPYPGAAIAPNPNAAWVIINVEIQLNQVVDLTRASERRLIDTTVEESTGDWRGYLLRNPNPAVSPPYYTNVPTQRLGHAMHEVEKLEGFLTYSARSATRKNLVVFPGKLQAKSFVKFENPITKDVLILP